MDCYYCESVGDWQRAPVNLTLIALLFSSAPCYDRSASFKDDHRRRISPRLTCVCVCVCAWQRGWSEESNRDLYANVLRPAEQSVECVCRDDRRLFVRSRWRSLTLAANTSSETLLKTHFRSPRVYLHKSRAGSSGRQVATFLFLCLYIPHFY